MAFFYWKSQRFGKSLKTFGSRIFSLIFLKSIGWYGFSYGFLVVLNLFIQCIALSYYYFKFDKHCFIKHCGGSPQGINGGP